MATEINVNWSSIHACHHLQEQTRGWWETTKITTAHNKLEQSPDPFLVGGVAILMRNQSAHRVISTGSDPSNLGRWTWMRMRGRDNIHLRLVVAYRPVKNTTGPLSSYNQELRSLLAQGIDECPRERFTKDLIQQVQQWLADGDQIILGVDLNDDIRNSPTA